MQGEYLPTQVVEFHNSFDHQVGRIESGEIASATAEPDFFADIAAEIQSRYRLDIGDRATAAILYGIGRRFRPSGKDLHELALLVE